MLLSLVAMRDARLVGHVLYSPATIEGKLAGAALGPMAVLPEYQRTGIGSELVETGSERLRAEGFPFVIVLGDPEFYPRFGFEPANARGVSCEWDVADNVFMLQILDEGKMRGVSGLATYRPEFSTVV